MSYRDDENQKQPITNNHLKQLFGLDDDLQNHYFKEIQRKYWNSLKAANDNRGDNE